MIDLSIIIVSYNTKQFLLDSVQSVIKTTKNISYEIIIVDNNSRDGSVEAIRNFQFSIFNSQSNTKNKNFQIIKNGENLGFSKANNIGVGKAQGRYILFLNSDTIVYEKTLETMVRFMDNHKDCGIATCRVNLINGEIDDASHRGFPTPVRSLFYFSGLSKIFSNSLFFNGYHLGYRNLSKIHEIEACAGAFMIVRKEAGKDIGWFDKDYFFYGEDLDFCYKIKNKGWKIYYVPVVSILHYKGVSGGIKKISQNITTANRETKKRVLDARFNAMEIFYRKNYINKYPWIVTWLVIKGIALISFLQH